ncbi:Subtilisin-like protease SBT5.1, partial [Mucuna pruriens]
KLIGARYYPAPQGENDYETPRDKDGHGTHVASSGSPESGLAIYKVGFKYDCPGSAILAAFDDAIADGVHVMSLSVGSFSELKYDPIGGTEREDFGDFPVTEISSKDAATILNYVNLTSNKVATMLPTVSVIDFKPAPMIPSFSAKGPSALSKNILYPDIAASGVNILASWIALNDTEDVPKGEKPSQFNILSGTSMACPHVSGLAAAIKSHNPAWTASAIKSAIMTTATQKNNLKGPITTDEGSVATPYEYGAGQMTIYGAFHPWLVYETRTIDCLNYLRYVGFNITMVKTISRTLPQGFEFSSYISNINYPSIAISELNGKGFVNVTRTVTNVGEEDETVYSPVVDAPSGVNVKLIPNKLQFTKTSKKLSYQVIFPFTSTTLKDDIFGSITWSNGKYTVRSPFVLAK